MLTVKNLKKTYKTKKKVVEAVKNISFTANEGEVFALLGPNGAGKSTTIKSILGLVIPDEGDIYVGGVNAIKNRKKALFMMSAVLEGNRNIHWRLSVKENFQYFGALKGLGGKRLKERMMEVSELLGIEDKLNTIAGNLSRGYQQRLAIAIAILPDVPLILLDEPTLGLDVESAIEIRGIIKLLSKQGKTVLLSTHDMNLVEAISDRVLIISGGKVVTLGTTKELKEMFKARSYKIVFERKPSGKIIDKLKEMVILEEKDNGDFAISVNFSTSSHTLYDIFEVLKEEKPQIKSIESEDPNFEEIFLRIIRGEKDA